MPKEVYEKQLQTWIEDEKAALELIAITGKLWFDHSIELIIFRNQMVDRSASELLNLHHYAREVVRHPLSVHDTLGLAKAIYENHLAPSRLDIGRIGVQWLDEKSKYANESEFIRNKLANYIGSDKINLRPKDVVLYGFGRIGRIAARELITQAGKGEQLRLRAIVTRDKSPDDIIKRADLLRSDSVHGHFPGTVIADVEQRCIWVNGHKIDMISAGTPEEIVLTPATSYVAEFTRNVARAKVIRAQSLMVPAQGGAPGGEPAGPSVSARANIAEAAPLFLDGVAHLDVTDEAGKIIGRLNRDAVVALMLQG